MAATIIAWEEDVLDRETARTEVEAPASAIHIRLADAVDGHVERPLAPEGPCAYVDAAIQAVHEDGRVLASVPVYAARWERPWGAVEYALDGSGERGHDEALRLGTDLVEFRGATTMRWACQIQDLTEADIDRLAAEYRDAIAELEAAADDYHRRVNSKEAVDCQPGES